MSEILKKFRSLAEDIERVIPARVESDWNSVVTYRIGDSIGYSHYASREGGFVAETIHGGSGDDWHVTIENGTLKEMEGIIADEFLEKKVDVEREHQNEISSTLYRIRFLFENYYESRDYDGRQVVLTRKGMTLTTNTEGRVFRFRDGMIARQSKGSIRLEKMDAVDLKEVLRILVV